MMKSFFAVLLSFVSLEVFASGIVVRGRVQDLETHCRYYSNHTGEFLINYENRALPWGTQVAIRYGFKEGSRDMDWASYKRILISASAPYTWAARIHEIVHIRGAYEFSQIQFVFEIRLPDGRIIWDKGSQTRRGFFSADFPELACENNTPFRELAVVANERN